ncbi:class I SAM-dependent methyltransferase [bacterium]|nr:class I SAM-dependent methyltransferase [bacterium]
MKRFPVESVLDLGSRQGELLSLIAERLPKVERFVATDMSKSNLDECRKNGFEGFKIDLETETLPFDDEVFDCVLATEIFEHLAHHNIILAEIYRVLKPDGRLIVTVPNVAMLRKRIEMLFGKDPNRVYPPSAWDVHIREYSGESLSKLLAFYDFVRDSITYIPSPRGNILFKPLKQIVPSLRLHILGVFHKKINKK